MVAERAGWREPPDVPGLVLVLVGADSATAAIGENLTVNEQGFDPNAVAVSDEAAEAFRTSLIGCAAVTGYWGRRAVAAGMHKPVRDGRAELAGIATLIEFRGRGFGGAVAARLTRVAFTAGAHTVFLTTDDEAAHRVYRRSGFRDAAS
jgi:predicted GNAT family acetyltransferase